MKKYISSIIIVFVFHISANADNNTNDSIVKTFLKTKGYIRDTSDLYHEYFINEIYKYSDKKSTLSISEFGLNTSHPEVRFILIRKNEDVIFVGDKDVKTELKGLLFFFDENNYISPKIRNRCYEFLIVDELGWNKLMIKTLEEYKYIKPK